MKVVRKGNLDITRLLSINFSKDADYRIMKYTLRAEYDGNALFHNVMTGEMVILDKDESVLIDHFPAKYSEKMQELIQAHFLVPVEYDEKDTVEKLRVLLKRMRETKNIVHYILLTTTNCNARCFYCYESNIRHLNMNEDMAEKIVQYMINHCAGKPLLLDWFGGEPLLGIERIHQICHRLQEEGIPYNSNMTSNGYLLNEEVIDSAVSDWNLKSIQITVDGTEEIYNRTKAYAGVSHSSPFQRVMRNIEMLLKHGIWVHIRMNIDQSNAEDLENLSQYLYDRFNKYKTISAYAVVVQKDAGFEPIGRKEEDEKRLDQLQVSLNKRLEELGLARALGDLPTLQTVHCTADSENALVVFPDGSFFKCENVHEEECIGHVEKEAFNQTNLELYQTRFEREACESCPLYPSCVLLDNCPGKYLYNQYTCEHRIEKGISSMLEYIKKNYKIQGETKGAFDHPC